MKQGARQASRLRVLLAWVIRGQKDVAGRQAREVSVLETRTRCWQDVAKLLIGAQISIESEASQRDDRFYVAQHSQLVQKIGLAVCDFLTIRFIAGRSAADHLCNEAIAEGEAVLTMGRIRLVCETEAV